MGEHNRQDDGAARRRRLQGTAYARYSKYTVPSGTEIEVARPDPSLAAGVRTDARYALAKTASALREGTAAPAGRPDGTHRLFHDRLPAGVGIELGHPFRERRSL